MNERSDRDGRDGRSRNGWGRRKTVTLGSDHDRVPPHSNDAETAVLGAMMLDREAADAALMILGVEDFYRETHRIIFEAMVELRRANEPIDIITLNDRLKAMERLEDVGGALYLSQINMQTPTAANVRHHARIVFEQSLKRRVIGVGMELISACYDPTADAFEQLESAAQKIYRLAELRSSSNYRSYQQLATEALAHLEKLQALGGAPVGILTGLSRLDSIIGGLLPTNLYLIAGRPAMGKTACGVTIHDHVQSLGYSSVFDSLEMGRLQLFLRQVSQHAGIAATRLFTGSDLHAQDYEHLASTVLTLRDRPGGIDDTGAVSTLELVTKARALHRRRQLDVLVVDYAGLVQQEAENRAREQTIVAYTLKALAKELDIPVVLLSQLNRDVTTRGDKRPQLSDLKDSGGLEEAADVVIFVHRPEYYGILNTEDGLDTEGLAELIVAKQRNGPTGIATCAFLEDVVRFADLAPQGLTPVDSGLDGYINRTPF